MTNTIREPIWLKPARAAIGQREIVGTKHNPWIVRLWGMIRAPFSDDETPWCAGFVGGMLEASGIKSTRSARSLSYLTYGQPLNAPLPGCIAVKKRVGGGHVTFIVASDGKGGLWCLGGNQGDAVSVVLYPQDAFVAFRWPPGIPINYTPLPVVKSASAAAVPKEA